MTINLITIVENQETLSELATLRSTLADSDEVNVSIKYISYHLCLQVNQYKARELKEKEQELQKLTEDLKVFL